MVEGEVICLQATAVWVMDGCAGGGWIRHVEGGVHGGWDGMVEITAWESRRVAG